VGRALAPGQALDPGPAILLVRSRFRTPRGRQDLTGRLLPLPPLVLSLLPPLRRRPLLLLRLLAQYRQPLQVLPRPRPYQLHL